MGKVFYIYKHIIWFSVILIQEDLQAVMIVQVYTLIQHYRVQCHLLSFSALMVPVYSTTSCKTFYLQCHRIDDFFLYGTVVNHHYQHLEYLSLLYLPYWYNIVS